MISVLTLTFLSSRESWWCWWCYASMLLPQEEKNLINSQPVTTRGHQHSKKRATELPTKHECTKTKKHATTEIFISCFAANTCTLNTNTNSPTRSNVQQRFLLGLNSKHEFRKLKKRSIGYFNLAFEMLRFSETKILNQNPCWQSSKNDPYVIYIQPSFCIFYCEDLKVEHMFKHLK